MSIAKLEPITNYLEKRKRFSVVALFLSLYHLQERELEKRLTGDYLTYEDIKDIVERELEDIAAKEKTVSGGQEAFFMIREEDIEAHAGLLYEGFVRPKMSEDGPRLMLGEESFEMREEEMLKQMEECLKYRNEGEKGRYEGTVERFRVDGEQYLGGERGGNAASSSKSQEMSQYGNYNSQSLSFLVREGGKEEAGLALGSNSHISMRALTIERDHTIVRFLALIRKSNMDMIFPQELYDKIMLTLFMALKCGAPLAHREVMDMVMAAKEMRVFGEDLESVPKTKLRGILTLLKNCQSIRTEGEGDGEGIRLFLGEGVSNFQSFRDKHDVFLENLLSHEQLSIANELKGEVLWRGHEDARRQKAVGFRESERLLEDFYVRGILPTGIQEKMRQSVTSFSKEELMSNVGFFQVERSIMNRSRNESEEEDQRGRRLSGGSNAMREGERERGDNRKILAYDDPALGYNHHPSSQGRYPGFYSTFPSSLLPPPALPAPGNNAHSTHNYSSYLRSEAQNASSLSYSNNRVSEEYNGRSSFAEQSQHSLQSEKREEGHPYHSNIAAIPSSQQALFAQALTHIRPRKLKDSDHTNGKGGVMRSPSQNSPYYHQYPPSQSSNNEQMAMMMMTMKRDNHSHSYHPNHPRYGRGEEEVLYDRRGAPQMLPPSTQSSPQTSRLLSGYGQPLLLRSDSQAPASSRSSQYANRPFSSYGSSSMSSSEAPQITARSNPSTSGAFNLFAPSYLDQRF